MLNGELFILYLYAVTDISICWYNNLFDTITDVCTLFGRILDKSSCFWWWVFMSFIFGYILIIFLNLIVYRILLIIAWFSVGCHVFSLTTMVSFVIKFLKLWATVSHPFNSAQGFERTMSSWRYVHSLNSLVGINFLPALALPFYPWDISTLFATAKENMICCLCSWPRGIYLANSI